MNCKECENLMELFIQKDLPVKDEKMVEEHVNHCKTCSETLIKTRKLVSTLQTSSDNITMPDWDKSWTIIKRNIERESKPKRPIWNPRYSPWKYAVVGSIIIFLLGFLAGKKLFISTPLEESLDLKTPKNLQYAICAYLEDIKPFILEYGNYQPTQKNEVDFSFEKTLAGKLLMKNRILQAHMLRMKNIKIQQLLTELEIILMEISNMDTNESENFLFIKNLIKMKRTLYKIEKFYWEQFLNNDLSGGVTCKSILKKTI